MWSESIINPTMLFLAQGKCVINFQQKHCQFFLIFDNFLKSQNDSCSKNQKKHRESTFWTKFVPKGINYIDVLADECLRLCAGGHLSQRGVPQQVKHVMDARVSRDLVAREKCEAAKVTRQTKLSLRSVESAITIRQRKTFTDGLRARYKE